MLEENEGILLPSEDGKEGFSLDEKEGFFLASVDGKEGFLFDVKEGLLLLSVDGNDGLFLSRLKGNEDIFLSLVDSNEGKSIDGGDGKGRLAFLRNFLGGILDIVGDGEEDGTTLNGISIRYQFV